MYDILKAYAWSNHNIITIAHALANIKIFVYTHCTVYTVVRMKYTERIK